MPTHPGQRRNERTLVMALRVACVAMIVAIVSSAFGAANDQVLTPKVYVPVLARAQTVLLEARTVTVDGPVDPGPVLEVMTRRMEEIRYTVTTNPHALHDVGVQMICEEATPAQFDGPPCLLTYQLGGQQMDWQRINRVVFTISLQATRELEPRGPEASAMGWFTQYLEYYDFPVLLSAEWGQIDRLRTLLDAPDTHRRRKSMIISLLGETHADEAFPCLTDALHDEALVVGAARALGNFGQQARAPLMELLRTSSRADVQAAAAYGLGNVGASTGDTSATPLLLQVLDRPEAPRSVQIEVVWALGKSPDFRAHPALERLEAEIWHIRSDDPEVEELRKAVQWTLRQVRQGGHTDAY